MKPSEEQISQKLQLYEGIVSRKLEKLEEGKIPEHNIPKVYRKVGSRSRTVGLFELALDNCDEAVTDLATATEWYRDAIEAFRARRDSPKDDFEGETTLLCGDDDLLTEAAELVRETEPDHYDRFDTQRRYYYTQALAASILDAGDQQEFLNDLERTITATTTTHTRPSSRRCGSPSRGSTAATKTGSPRASTGSATDTTARSTSRTRRAPRISSVSKWRPSSSLPAGTEWTSASTASTSPRASPNSLDLEGNV